MLLLAWLTAALAASPTELWTDAQVPVELLQDGAVRVVWRVGEAELALQSGPGDATTRACGSDHAHLIWRVPTDDAPTRATVDAACDRLRNAGDLWAARADRPEVRPLAPARPRPLWAFSLLWWLLLPAMLPRCRAALGWALASFAARLLAAPPTVLMSGDYPYQRLLAALGTGGVDPQNGDGFSAIFGWVGLALGGPPHLAHALNLVLGALTAAWLFDGARRHTDDRLLAHFAVAVWVLQPVALRLSTSECMFPLVVALQAAAWASWAHGGRHRWFAALSLGLLCNVRPLQLLIVPVWAALWYRREHVRPLLLVASLFLWRTAELVVNALAAGGAPSSGRFDQVTWTGLWRAITGHPSSLLVTEPTLAPWWTVPLAALGAAALSRSHPDLLRHAALTLAVTLLTAAHQDRLTDLVRFQLPALLWWSLLAAAGLRALYDHRAARAPLLIALLHGLWLSHAALRPPPTWASEHHALWAHLRRLPAVEVRYDPAWDPHTTFAQWARRVGPSTWRPITPADPLRTGELIWLGRASRWPGALPLTCTLRPLRTWTLPAIDWQIEQLGDAPITIGLHRAERCPEPSRPLGGP